MKDLPIPITPTKPLKFYVRRKFVNHLSKPQNISSSSSNSTGSTLKEIVAESEINPAKEDSQNGHRKEEMANSNKEFEEKVAESETFEDSEFVDGKEKTKKNAKVAPKKQRFHRPRILEDGKKPRNPATTRLRTISGKRKKKEKVSEEEIIIEPRTPEKQNFPKRRKSEKTKRSVVRPLVFDDETVVSCLELSRNYGPNFPTARRRMTIVRRSDFHGLISMSFPMPIWKKQSKRSNRKRNSVRWTEIALLEVNDLSSQASASLQIEGVPLVQQVKSSLPEIPLQIKGNKRSKKGKEKPKRLDKKTKDSFEHLIQQMRYQKDHGLSSLADVPLHIEDTLMKYASCVSSKQRGTKDFAKLIKGMKKLNIKKRVTTVIKSSKKKILVTPKVDLDSETIRIWELLMRNDIPEAKSKVEGEEYVSGGAYIFINRMRLVLGNREFKQWKASVIDSLIGVFLTQNVSDRLSSNAFMNVAAKFPAKSPKGSEGLEYYIEEPLEVDDSVVNNHGATYIGNNDANSSEFISLSEASIQEAGEHEKTAKRKNEKTGIIEDEKVDWKSHRNMYKKEGPRDKMHMDCVDWNQVRLSGQAVLANTIKQRGQFNVISGRALKCLNKEVEENGNLDLEWLRYAPPDLARRYLLGIEGIGLKSTECVRLLGLKHSAFPVDTNVARISTRLGWIPLEPLPNGVQLHQLDQYPSMDSIQKYLWARLYKLPQETLYELHYLMITFGKVFCTKVLPNCNACPMKSECKYFASAYVSSNTLLQGPEEKSQKPGNTHESTYSDDVDANMTPNMTLEECASPKCSDQTNCCGSTVEYPSSPNMEISKLMDIEDTPYKSPYQPYVEIPKIDMDMDAFKKNVEDALVKSGKMPNSSIDDVSKALIVLTPEKACIPLKLPQKMKFYNRLRTEHLVYVLPDNHSLLAGFERRERDDHIPYLLAIWQPGETSYTFNPPKKKCDSDGSKLCEIKTCSYCWAIREKNSNTFRGTILIPCRTAMRGGFPLNGTYFQTNEVFADHETSLNPIVFPREWCEGLEKRAVYCGSGVTSICRFLDTSRILLCFRIGFICIRAFDRKTRNPKDLVRRLHTPPDGRGKKHMREFDE